MLPGPALGAHRGNGGPIVSRIPSNGSLPEGRSVRIAEIVPGAAPNSDNAIDLKVLDRHGIPVVADRLFHSGEHQTHTVRTVDGHEVTGTSNHPLLCLVDLAGVPTLLWKLIEEIVPGDVVVMHRDSTVSDGNASNGRRSTPAPVGESRGCGGG